MKLQIFQTKSQPTSHQLIDLVARHGIEACPLAFQTSTLPSSSRASSTLVDGARLELALHGCRPWVIPLYEPPSWGEMRESNSRDWSHNPVPKPFGQSRHRIWSCWLDSHRHRPAYKAGAFVCRPQQQNLELARSLELRSGAYHAPALPVELYQRSWRGDSNADHGLTRPALFLLSYTSTTNSGGGGENCTPDDLLCRQMPCCLGYTASNIGAEGGTR